MVGNRDPVLRASRDGIRMSSRLYSSLCPSLATGWTSVVPCSPSVPPFLGSAALVFRCSTVLSDVECLVGVGSKDLSVQLLAFCPSTRTMLVPRLGLAPDSSAGRVPCGADVAKECYLVDPASSHMLVSKIKPCMCKYELIQTVKLRMAH